MRYKIKINDDERQLIVKALYDWRNQLPTDSLLRPDLEQLKAEDRLPDRASQALLYEPWQELHREDRRS